METGVTSQTRAIAETVATIETGVTIETTVTVKIGLMGTTITTVSSKKVHSRMRFEAKGKVKTGTDLETIAFMDFKTHLVKRNRYPVLKTMAKVTGQSLD